ncbi:MAG TPA: hypothetical protein VFK70_15575 [Vicinamibacteria bacterium]|nr:hypothetical protein [Vicinamibacteria bacterium]
MITSLLLVLACVAASPSPAASTQPSPEPLYIDYVPFTLETSVPLTPDQFMRQAYRWTLKGDRAETFGALLVRRKQQAGYSPHFLRLIVWRRVGPRIEVDAVGDMLEGGKQYRLDRDAFAAMEATLNEMAAKDDAARAAKKHRPH